GVAAMILVATGLHGVISYFVVRRTKEIGIRMALGAERTGVLGLVARDVTVLIFLGIGTGVLAGIQVTKYVGALLFGVKPLGFSSLTGPAAVLILACALAALRPAIRATR